MKRNFAAALFALSTLATSAGVLAQGPAVVANVPFAFTVADKTLPAGEYTLTSTSAGTVQLRGIDPSTRVSTAAVRGSHPSGDQSKLVFYKYGGQYFLHQVLSPNIFDPNVSIPASSTEKRVRTQEAKLAKPEEVLLAAR